MASWKMQVQIVYLQVEKDGRYGQQRLIDTTSNFKIFLQLF